MASSRIKDTFRSLSASMGWFDRAYLVDWAVVVVLHIGSEAIGNYMPVYERAFSIDDPLINHPFANPERVPGRLATFLSVGVALIVAVLGGIWERSIMEIHHGCLAAVASSSVTRIIVEFLKNRIGRLRPDFLARCAWSVTLQACTGRESAMLDGRRSFPSGHSSGAFAGLTFVFLYLAGKTGCLTPGSSAEGLLSSRLLRLVISLSPLVLATWIAVTRIEDYRHHKEDIIVGSLLGATFASIAYHMYWHSPFGLQHGTPKTVYSDDVSHKGFVLTSSVDEENNETA